MIRSFFLLSIFLHLSISLGFACPYCFIDEESPQVRSGEAGVLVLGGFVVFVLSVIASLAFKWAKRARKLDRAAAEQGRV